MSEHIVTKYVYTFSPDHEPVAKVGQGEVVTLETLDCFSNQIKSEEDELTSVDFSKVNTATGHVYVEGAETGDYLVVDILDVQVDAQGVVVNGRGLVHDRMRVD